MNSAANSQNSSVNTVWNGIGWSEGSQATNHLTCAAATLDRGIALIVRHPMMAVRVAVLDRTRLNPSLIRPLPSFATALSMVLLARHVPAHGVRANIDCTGRA